MEVVPKSESGTGQNEIYVVLDGVCIAKRGQPDTPQARTWVSLEPGYRVYDSPDKEEIVVEYNGAVIE